MRKILVAAATAMFATIAAPNAFAAEVCNQLFPIELNGITHYHRFCANVDFQTENRRITELQLFIHGVGRTGYFYSRNMYNVIDDPDNGINMGQRYAILAPQFIRIDENGQCIRSNAECDQTYDPIQYLDLGGTHTRDLYWGSGWPDGDLSQSGTGDGFPARERISSYDVLDQLIAHGISIYPNLQRIVIAGHSAGGQMVSRYIYFANIPSTFPEDRVVFVPTNPSSYPYLTAERPLSSSDDAPLAHPITYGIPTSADCDGLVLRGGDPDPGAFSGYENWKWVSWMSMMTIFSTAQITPRRRLHHSTR
jgi:hypothetical protein